MSRDRRREDLNVSFAESRGRSPACTDRTLPLDGGISLARSKDEWKRFGYFPGRGGKRSDLGQGQESPDASG